MKPLKFSLYITFFVGIACFLDIFFNSGRVVEGILSPILGSQKKEPTENIFLFILFGITAIPVLSFFISFFSILIAKRFFGKHD